MPKTVGIPQIGHLTGYRDVVFGGKGRHSARNVGTAGGIVGVEYPDHSRVTQYVVLVQSPHEQKRHQRGEREHGGVDELDTSVQQSNT